ncbi:MAG: hypothetical protein AB7U20_15245 [Planctomycetaceae bacterium]
MARSLCILAELARDWVIAMALFIMASVGAGWCEENLTPNVDLYLTWFTLWMVPLILYAKWRGVGDGDLRGWAVHMSVFVGIWQSVLLLLGKERQTWLFEPDVSMWFRAAAIVFATTAAVYVSSLISQRLLSDHNHPTGENTLASPEEQGEDGV